MTTGYVHLLLNHIPILGVPGVFITLLYGSLRKEASVVRLGLILLVCVGVVTPIVYITGEPAEEQVEHLPGVSERKIEAHEAAATGALIATEVLAAFGLAVLLLGGDPERVRRRAGMLSVAALPAIGMLVWTGKLGGEIRHTEFLKAESSVAMDRSVGATNPGDLDGDGDDN